MLLTIAAESDSRIVLLPAVWWMNTILMLRPNFGAQQASPREGSPPTPPG